jgi:hypothetical protein
MFAQTKRQLNSFYVGRRRSMNGAVTPLSHRHDVCKALQLLASDKRNLEQHPALEC